MTGFTNADLTIENGTLSAVVLGRRRHHLDGDADPDGRTSRTPATSSRWPTAGVTDLAGNAGVGTSGSNNYAIDTVRTASIVVADANLIAGETSLVTITFSEAVTGFTNADLTIENGTLSAVSSADGGITWTATLHPDAAITDATNLITLAAGSVSDLAGNAGSGTTSSNNYAIDTVASDGYRSWWRTPILSLATTSLVTFTFSEAVTGFTNADLTIENGTLSAVSSADGGITWTATLTPNAAITDATNLITLADGGVSDLAGNAGSGTTSSNNYAIDTVASDGLPSWWRTPISSPAKPRWSPSPSARR